MTENRRILLNIAATYGRSLYALLIGLFCGRWSLMALGEVDYGLMGLVGGLTVVITFLNSVMASGVGRFYAIQVGVARQVRWKGLIACRQWFTTAVVVHTVLPVVLVAAGYPVGEWAVCSFLTIPPDRVQACVWVWRCVCVTAFVNMVSVPFSAWYTAKQEIAELTIYGVVTSTLNVGFMYYAVHHPGKWLVPLACWAMLLSIIPQVIICFRAGIKYRECRFVWGYVRSCWGRIGEMLRYSGWALLGTVADLLSTQGMGVLVNKFFGPRVNAAQAVGNTLSGQCTALSGSLTGAFWPAIISAYGAGDYVQVQKRVRYVCKIGSWCVAVFAIPLSVEIDEVLRLWLVHPPEFTAGLCLLALAVALIDRMTYGCAIAVHASGKLAGYQSVVATLFLLAFPLAYVFCEMGKSVYWIGGALLIARGSCAMARLVMARRVSGLGVRVWARTIALPLLFLYGVSFGGGLLIREALTPSFFRVVMTTAGCEAVLFFGAWFLLLTGEDRAGILAKAVQLKRWRRA